MAVLMVGGLARAGNAPDWMHAQVGAPLPPHDDKAEAVELYAETVLTVAPNGKITRLERKVFKILRPDGAGRGIINLSFDAQTRIEHLRAWSIPQAGKDYEVGERDATTINLAVAGGELAGDLRLKHLQIPAATPGNIIGYEWEQVQRPYVFEDDWRFQDTIPVREARYRLQLPPGWTYKATWLNHALDPPAVVGVGQSQWVVTNVEPIERERRMPPWGGIAGGLVIALLPPGGNAAGFQTWSDFGNWYSKLALGRRDASPQMRQKVTELTASAPTLIDKARALAHFVQNDIRYVAIELGIGGFQPHPAAETFSHGYGDCKDKATLLSAMLSEIGLESYYVIINTERGSITASTPPNLRFNHAILAIALPDDAKDLDLPARMVHPSLGQILFFDPTDSLTPFGRLRGPLQANYGALVTPKGGELVQLPELPAALNTLERTARMTLDDQGTLRGDFHEVWSGDRAARQRYALRSVNADTDQIKPVEARVAASLSNFQIMKASVRNLHAVEQPFEWNYSLQAEAYAKVAGDLLLIRPRLLGLKAVDPLESNGQPRRYPIEFEESERDTDQFEIIVPRGYVADALPPPVHAQTGFASYDSHTEMVGSVLRYTRSYEVRTLSLPAAQADEYDEFYRLIARDERSTAIFRRKPGAD